jgi:hypothetical protein
MEVGEVRPDPAVTSAWWESAEAIAFYARGVNLPACHHPPDLPAWPVTPSLALRTSA